MARRRRRRQQNLLDRWRGSAVYPFLLIGIVLAIIAFCWLLISQPTQQAQIGDLSGKIREVLLTNKFKYVGKPILLGDEVFFSSGQDNFYNPLMK